MDSKPVDMTKFFKYFLLVNSLIEPTQLSGKIVNWDNMDIWNSLVYVTRKKEFLSGGALLNSQCVISDYNEFKPYIHGESDIKDLWVAIAKDEIRYFGKRRSHQPLRCSKDGNVKSVIDNALHESNESLRISLIFVSILTTINLVKKGG